MKLKQKISLFSLGILLTLPFSTSYAADANKTDIVSGKECSNPTEFVEINSVTGPRFDKLQIKVPRATCVKITLNNKDLGKHDFTILGSEDIETVHIVAERKKSNSFNVLTPDKDDTFEFLCTVSGHYTQGMKGDFIIGKGLQKKKEGSFFNF
ncbi:MAG: hypothetical protein HQK84_12435 [Nitrospinae bacterium]|nr:hypothetical protein [Nitrospinota bacterium]